jgi:hypothetical protein
MVIDFAEIKTTTTNHFAELYTQKEEAIPINIFIFLEHIPSLITIEDNIEINPPIFENEIQTNIWSLEPDKGPRSHGFSISFYLFFWDLIKTFLKIMLHFSHQTLCL